MQKFESRLSALNGLLVGHYNVKAHSVEKSGRKSLYVGVSDWWSDRSMSWEPSHSLFVPSPFQFNYYINYILVEPVVPVRSKVCGMSLRPRWLRLRSRLTWHVLVEG